MSFLEFIEVEDQLVQIFCEQVRHKQTGSALVWMGKAER